MLCYMGRDHDDGNIMTHRYGWKYDAKKSYSVDVGIDSRKFGSSDV